MYVLKPVRVDDCYDLQQGHVVFQNKWDNISGIYKVTFLPFRLFTYYGSSKNLGGGFKDHYTNTKRYSSFIGVFISVFIHSRFQ